MQHIDSSSTVRTLRKSLIVNYIIVFGIGTAIYLLCRQLTSIPNIVILIIAVSTGILAGLIASINTTNKLNEPIKEMQAHAMSLQRKLNSSSAGNQKSNLEALTLLEGMPLGVLAFNHNMALTIGNGMAFSLFRLNEKDATSEAIFNSLHGKKSSGAKMQFEEWLDETRNNKIQATKIWPFVTFDTSSKTVSCDVIAYYNKGDSGGNDLTLLFIDRTNEYNHQEKHMDFIALAAHELRGPITVMRGLVDILNTEAGQTLSKEHQNLITRIIVSSRQLAGYIDNILSVSRIDKDDFKIQQRETDWLRLLKQSTQDLALRASAHRRVLELNMPKDLPSVAVDPGVITHVISNIIDNAIKYSKEGGKIIVSTKQIGDSIETTVQDFGIGIPSNVVEHLFTRFYRSHKSKQIVSGTGLGLYLCKTILEAHGGSIWVRSTEGSGTTFGFTIPTYKSLSGEVQSANKELGINRGTHGWIKNHSFYRQ